MKLTSTLPVLSIAFLLSACTPHSASGVWTTTEDNEYGITKLIVAFEGRANFSTPKLDNANWRCFWSANSEHKTIMDCTPSTNPDQEEQFILTVNTQGMAELQHNSKLITTLTRQDENPSPKL